MIVFGSLVKVIAGFYMGCYGGVYEIHPHWLTEPTYGVALTCKTTAIEKYQHPVQELPGSSLKLIPMHIISDKDFE